MNIPVFDLNGKQLESVSVKGLAWDEPVNKALLLQAVHMYRANQRAGTASTKTRGEVSGGGKKPWKQKHTGRARAGSNRSPIWRHGGVTFGPKPRDFSYTLPQAIRRGALLESIKGKVTDAELVLINQIHATEPKTKPFAKLASIFKAGNGSVIVLDQFTVPVVKSLRNLPAFTLHRADELNAFDVVNARKVLVTKAAFQRLEARLNGEAQPSAEVKPKAEKTPGPLSPKTTAKTAVTKTSTKTATKAKPTRKKAA